MIPGLGCSWHGQLLPRAILNDGWRYFETTSCSLWCFCRRKLWVFAVFEPYSVRNFCGSELQGRILSCLFSVRDARNCRTSKLRIGNFHIERFQTRPERIEIAFTAEQMPQFSSNSARRKLLTCTTNLEKRRILGGRRAPRERFRWTDGVGGKLRSPLIHITTKKPLGLPRRSIYRFPETKLDTFLSLIVIYSQQKNTHSRWYSIC